MKLRDSRAEDRTNVGLERLLGINKGTTAGRTWKVGEIHRRELAKIKAYLRRSKENRAVGVEDLWG